MRQVIQSHTVFHKNCAVNSSTAISRQFFTLSNLIGNDILRSTKKWVLRLSAKMRSSLPSSKTYSNVPQVNFSLLGRLRLNTICLRRDQIVFLDLDEKPKHNLSYFKAVQGVKFPYCLLTDLFPQQLQTLKVSNFWLLGEFYHNLLYLHYTYTKVWRNSLLIWLDRLLLVKKTQFWFYWNSLQVSRLSGNVI